MLLTIFTSTDLLPGNRAWALVAQETALISHYNNKHDGSTTLSIIKIRHETINIGQETIQTININRKQYQNLITRSSNGVFRREFPLKELE